MLWSAASLTASQPRSWGDEGPITHLTPVSSAATRAFPQSDFCGNYSAHRILTTFICGFENFLIHWVLVSTTTCPPTHTPQFSSYLTCLQYCQWRLDLSLKCSLPLVPVTLHSPSSLTISTGPSPASMLGCPGCPASVSNATRSVQIRARLQLLTMGFLVYLHSYPRSPSSYQNFLPRRPMGLTLSLTETEVNFPASWLLPLGSFSQ